MAIHNALSSFRQLQGTAKAHARKLRMGVSLVAIRAMRLGRAMPHNVFEILEAVCNDFIAPCLRGGSASVGKAGGNSTSAASTTKDAKGAKEAKESKDRVRSCHSSEECICRIEAATTEQLL